MSDPVEAMTGPQRFQAAAALIALAHDSQSDNGPGCGSEELLAEASVQASLAIAAAIIDATRVQTLIMTGAKTAGGTTRTMLARWSTVTAPDTTEGTRT